jgi:hypothetical protein
MHLVPKRMHGKHIMELQKALKEDVTFTDLGYKMLDHFQSVQNTLMELTAN